MNDVRACVVEAKLVLEEGCDPAAVGAVITVELCGDWEHAGACRWPHNNAIEVRSDHARFRTVFVAAPAETTVVRRRIVSALRAAAEWHVVSVAFRTVADAEPALAERLLRAPRLLG